MKTFWRRYGALWALIIIILLPLLEWLRLRPLVLRFSDIYASSTSIGQILGLAGMMLFSLNLIITARSKSLDRFFYGLNNLYAYHRAIGSLAFSLLLFHPLFLAAVYFSSSPWDAALFLLPVGATATSSGVIALWLMIILIGLTFYGSLKYHNWKLSHKLMVAAFIFALIHSALIASDISRDVFIRYYVLSFGFIGLAAGAYQSFLRRFLGRDYKYIVKEVRQRGDKMTEFILEKSGRPMTFKPGQFVFVRIPDSKFGSESHPFSLSSSPEDQNVSLTIKALGDFTSRLDEVKKGSRIVMEGPYGNFSYLEKSGSRQIWIAGGVGITPFLSMARNLIDNSYQIDFYYCVHSAKEAVFLDELQEINARTGALRIIPWYSSEKGRLTAEGVEINSPDFKKREILICGPLGLIDALKRGFKQINFPITRLHCEEFKLL